MWRGVGKGDRAGKAAKKKCVLNPVTPVGIWAYSCMGAIGYTSKLSLPRSWQTSTPTCSTLWLRAAPWAVNSRVLPAFPVLDRVLEKAPKPKHVDPGS